MKKCCKNCLYYECGLKDLEVKCSSLIPYPEVGCYQFECRKKKFVAVHKYLEIGFISIIGFSDSKQLLEDIVRNEPHFGSNRHYFLVTNNCVGDLGNEPSSHPLFKGVCLNFVKDSCLINFCKNVADCLAFAEYAMLKNSYFKSSAWFERAKNLASCASVIIDNY